MPGPGASSGGTLVGKTTRLPRLSRIRASHVVSSGPLLCKRPPSWARRAGFLTETRHQWLTRTRTRASSPCAIPSSRLRCNRTTGLLQLDHRRDARRQNNTAYRRPRYPDRALLAFRCVRRANDLAPRRRRSLPFASPCLIGAGHDGLANVPGRTLLSATWLQTRCRPEGDADRVERMLRSFILCAAMNFPAVRDSLSKTILVSSTDGDDWLAAILAQPALDVDAIRQGGLCQVCATDRDRASRGAPRQLLRRSRDPATWFAALRDPPIGRRLRALHIDRGER